MQTTQTWRLLWPLVWAALQLGWRPGRLLDLPGAPRGLLTFSPAQLTVPEGENATFVCSFSNTTERFVLNWYRLSPSNQTDKLAAFPEDRSQPGHDRRFHVTLLPGGRDFLMSIVAARRNDSGTYLCGAISLPPKINESPHAELTVTERVLEPPTEHPSPSPEPQSQSQGLVVGVTSTLVGTLLLLAWVLAASCLRAERGPRGPRGASSQDSPPEDPSGMPAATVDYGELDFQWREKTPEPPAPDAPEQTEYATIIFPERPAAPCPGRRGSADGPLGPRSPRPEDGHCSWPF
ncbi:programmed cell death protein 1 isoform X2 [Tupaia chinensis]|uniref:programmed cell death protein 1 isoform X2 n=1 Tax=Tupaia chinensis TaxID=246437 RepID=UPI000FFCBA77|nr:programmed cell death protein 1 isoform X2 [Tupaia chinensis]